MNIISCFRGALQAALCLSVLSSCSGALTGSSYEVRTPLSSTGIRLEGLGVELDPHFISQNVTRNDGATLEDWRDIVVRRVKMMDVQRFRVMLLPHWLEPVNDNQDSQVADMDRFTFDSAEMRSVCAVLDLAQLYDLDVLIRLADIAVRLVERSDLLYAGIALVLNKMLDNHGEVLGKLLIVSRSRHPVRPAPVA